VQSICIAVPILPGKTESMRAILQKNSKKKKDEK
jgi:hypothetical protein